MSSPAPQPILAETVPAVSAPTLSMRWFFIFFRISGFCGVLYELVWLRLAMAQFGVTSALVSIVLSTFMAGLGLGSWASGAYLRKHGAQLKNPLRQYALTELLIGVSAILVPYELLWGRRILESAAISASWAYYTVSGILVAVTLIPWCLCMGATIPVAMLAIRRHISVESPRAFSFLYLSNVAGAVGGAVLPLLLIEFAGFRATLYVAGVLNGLIALAAFALASRAYAVSRVEPLAESIAVSPKVFTGQRWTLLLLFTGGLTSMGIEVVWLRQFTPFLGSVVYTFATILVLYLLATFAGSQAYRRWSLKGRAEPSLIWLGVGISALTSLISANPQIDIALWERLLLAIVPFSGLLGFVTPMLVDRWSGGDPDRAGKAYALNVAGCIAGPLIAGFVLLPYMSERWGLYALALPWMLIGVLPGLVRSAKRPAWQVAVDYGLLLASLGAVFVSKGFEEGFASRVVFRDNTASVMATGTGMKKELYVNGVSMTFLTTITKYMAHLPLAFLDHPPQKALVICFGMGTTFRSLLSWNIDATAVDLIPSVPKAFSYFHNDAATLLQSPRAHVVIDDGRRFLERTTDSFDVITIDPPPPVPSAGSSLLYSRDFYTVVKRRLRPGGIVQQWLPSGDPTVRSSVAQALKQSFPYVRGFHSIGITGFHFLASNQPIPSLSPEQLAARMPASAASDFGEWVPGSTPQQQFGLVVNKEFSADSMIKLDPHAPVLDDDRPVNEYYLIRHRGERVPY